MSALSIVSSNVSSSSSGSMVICSGSISIVLSTSAGSIIGSAGCRIVYSKGSGSVISDRNFTVNFGSSPFSSAAIKYLGECYLKN